MKRFAILALSTAVVLGDIAWAIEEDQKHFGPLDGHTAKVVSILQQMDLPDDTRGKVQSIAEKSQAAWRAWYTKHRGEVDRFQERIQQLKAKDNRADLKKVLAEKKKFMHTAPSLLRNPEPIKELFSPDEYAVFLTKLDALRKALHDPKDRKRPNNGDAREPR